MAAYRREPREGHIAEANGSAAKFRRGSKQGHVVAGILPHLKRSLLELARLKASYLCTGGPRMCVSTHGVGLLT